jgi:hypothetical protein
MTRIGKGMATNGNRLRVEFELKNFNVRLGKIKVVVHSNKMACPQMEKSNFLHMNLRLMSYLGKGELNYKT